MSLRVVEVSGVSTVQDMGRSGHAHEGVPASGAADTLSLHVANRAAGNAGDAAGIEVAFGRLVIEATAPCVVVSSGGARAFEAIGVEAGEVIRVAPDSGLGRAYLAVAGGVDVTPVLGSRSTLASAGIGKPLAVGDVLPVGEAGGAAVDVPAWLRAMVDFAVRRRVLRVVRDGAGTPLPQGVLRVSPRSDRVGVRLERGGGRAAIETGPSRGTLFGTIQAPSSGELIVLGPDGPTTGGYAVAGTVIAADLPAVGQLAPGHWVGFEVVERAEAVAVLRDRARALASL